MASTSCSDDRTPKQPSFIQAIGSSILPLLIIYIHQPFIILGIAGMPTTWWDILTLDLDLVGLLMEGTLRSFICAFGTILAFVRPTIPGTSPRWLRDLFPAIAWLIYSDEATECEVKVAESNGQTSDSFFYINGICTTRRMAIATGFELAKMFNKNVSVVHNPTDSVLVDLLECVIGKLWIGRKWATGKPCYLLFKGMMAALTDDSKSKVVLIAHSQGTIIASNALEDLWEAVDNKKLPESAMKKLEIYNLANAAQCMLQRGESPYIESICNQRDPVGMLGANAPDRAKTLWEIDIAGDVFYPIKPRWGHMVSSHYLKHLKEGDYPETKLHTYVNQANVPETVTKG